MSDSLAVEAAHASPPGPPPGRAAPRIAVLIPCYNEEVAIPGVVRAFRTALPAAAIYVYDNNSRDRTREVAGAAGAFRRGHPIGNALKDGIRSLLFVNRITDML